jgi:hypothetical protein
MQNPFQVPTDGDELGKVGGTKDSKENLPFNIE